MGSETLLWALVALLVVAVAAIVVIVVVDRRRRRADAARAEAAEAAHRRELARVAGEHDEGVTALEGTHAREREQLESRVRDADEAAEQTRAFLRTGMHWDEASQRVITEVCTELGLDGVLVTNVLFVPADATSRRQFVAQVDHVLLLSTGAVVIENKAWRGVVLDGVQPRDVHSSLGTLLGEKTLEPPFAVQVVAESDESIVVRTRQGSRSPSTQVRQQARRVSELVGAETLRTQWFDTCVFYSHPDAEVWAADTDTTPGGAATAVVAGRQQLRGFLEGVGQRPRTLAPPRLEELTALFASRGADVRRFGAMALPDGAAAPRR